MVAGFELVMIWVRKYQLGGIGEAKTLMRVHIRASYVCIWCKQIDRFWIETALRHGVRTRRYRAGLSGILAGVFLLGVRVVFAY